MGGGLLQLKAYGTENSYLNGNPQMTFFKMAYRRYTNFSMQSIQLFNKGLDSLSYTMPSRVRFQIQRNADLFNKMFLSVIIPDIYCSESQQFRWIPRLGTNMIHNVKAFVGTTMVEQLDGEYIDIYYELNGSDELKEMVDGMSANEPPYYRPTAPCGAGFPFSTNQSYYSTDRPDVWMTSPHYLGKPTIPGKRIYIPLPFWFTKHIGQSVPLIALQNHEVFIDVEFRPIRDMYQIGIPEDVPLHESIYKADTATTPYFRIANTNTLRRVVWKRPDGPQDELKRFTGLLDNVWSLQPYLEVNYIFLDEDERKMFATMTHQYVIETVRRVSEQGILGSKTISLEIYHPVKEIIMVFRRDDHASRNQWSNYTNLEDDTTSPSEYYHYLLSVLYDLRNRRSAELASVLPADVYGAFMANPLYLFGMFRTDKLRTVDPIVYDREMLRTYLVDPTVSPPPISPNQYDLVSTLSLRYGKTVTLGEFRETILKPLLNVPYPPIGSSLSVGGSSCDCQQPSQLLLLSRNHTWNNDDVLQMMKQWEYRQAKDIPPMSRETYSYYQPNILEDMEIRFNGEVRLERKPHTYYSRLQPFMHHSRKPRNGIYTYSFSLEPEKSQPSGACNFSQLQLLELVLTLKDPSSVETGTYKNIKYNADFFIVSHNILQIMGGMAGLVYGN